MLGWKNYSGVSDAWFWETAFPSTSESQAK